MKKIFVTLCFLIAAINIGNAQNAQYEKKMKEAIAQMDSAGTAQKQKDVKALFERIANAEKTQWLPFYYAALCNTTIGWMDDKIDKDALAEETLKLLDKAEAIDKNSEIYCVRQMAYTQQMLVDPQTRFMTYGMKAGQALATAKKLDATNPRAVYLEGVGIKNTPEMFGGGCAKGKPILENAIKLFNLFKPASDLHPNWGKQYAEEQLKECK